MLGLNAIVGAEAASSVEWDELEAEEKAALAFMYLENIAGTPVAFRFLTRALATSDGSMSTLSPTALQVGRSWDALHTAARQLIKPFQLASSMQFCHAFK